ncbi:LacI family DNA-binding transcriptional regulator [Leeia sp. TBRC 13508]|uniref:LacI family DNA-binding transcriptional regulator n=1 Tax=Leeia speluncae TaxID=2884804 RepID=A0ABS8DBC6_9NEIS|nr:LacI family DNA-binding transcriptional regulator [Leeia speluncae]MCB6184923.1 LacI family DNA-binding transcriptional regulator [Leeia speluncae]
METLPKFSVKRISAQAGVSKATVDRVLHGRGNVHFETERRVHQAIEELEAQSRVSLASGRTFYIDVIMQAPKRFSTAVEKAMVEQVASLAPFRISPRFFFQEDISSAQLAKQLHKSLSNGAAGVIAKVPDDAMMTGCINEIALANIPVVTLVTDVPKSQRIAYVGMDNRSAGETAAYLMNSWLPTKQAAKVGVILSSQRFRGEEEREMGFRHWLRARAPQLTVIDISGGLGVDDKTASLVANALLLHPELVAIYSAGGGNQGVLAGFETAKRQLAVFIGHDMDEANRQLLQQEKIHAIIDHDLQADARAAFQHILQFHKVIPKTNIPFSRAQVITPFNLY